MLKSLYCNTRNHHSNGPKKNTERSTIRHPKSRKPIERGISIAVVKVATDEPEEQVERLRAPDVGIQAPAYLRE